MKKIELNVDMIGDQNHVLTSDDTKAISEYIKKRKKVIAKKSKKVSLASVKLQKA